MKFSIFIFIAIFCSIMTGYGQSNPFVSMASQKYDEYYARLDSFAPMDNPDSEQSAQIASQMREAAVISKNRKWNLEADYYQQCFHFYKELPHYSDDSVAVRLAEAFIPDLLVLAQKAEKIKAVDLRLRILYKVFCIYNFPIKNYELAFRQSQLLDQVMAPIPAEEFPLKPKYYLDIARLYYRFREYEAAESYFQKILENPNIAYQTRSLEAAYNGLGLIYKKYPDGLNKSDSCFSEILKIKPTSESLQFEYDLWSAIAQGNIAYNAFLREDYDQAIPIMKYALGKVVENNVYNYNYATGVAIVLAEIYVKKKNPDQARAYIDTARMYIDLTGDNDRWHSFYSVVSSYYALIGNTILALTYKDSTLIAREQYNNEFNALKLLRAEQQLKQEELDMEKMRTENYRRNFIMISIALFFVFVLLANLYFLYRKKRLAYQQLVLQSQKWAHSIHLEAEGSSEKQALPVSEEDYALMQQIDQLMINRKLFTLPAFSLEMLADETGVTRERLSKVINRSTGGNFKHYINEFRIKEAILWMSDPANKNLSLDAIIENVGCSRTPFYEAFKKITGLSPAEFRKNI